MPCPSYTFEFRTYVVRIFCAEGLNRSRRRSSSWYRSGIPEPRPAVTGRSATCVCVSRAKKKQTTDKDGVGHGWIQTASRLRKLACMPAIQSEIRYRNFAIDPITDGDRFRMRNSSLYSEYIVRRAFHRRQSSRDRSRNGVMRTYCRRACSLPVLGSERRFAH